MNRLLLVEFADLPSLEGAVKRLRLEGYRCFDAFTPFPSEAISEALGCHSRAVQILTLMGGLVGGVSGYALEYWANVYRYPLNIGGRPLNSVPSFIPVTFELTVLFAALTAAISMILLNGLPRLLHPVFTVPAFAKASCDRFFVMISQDDPLWNEEKTFALLNEWQPEGIYDAEEE